MILPDETAKVRKYRVPKPVDRGVIVAVTVFAVGLGFLVTDYFGVKKTVAELERLRMETRQQRQQLVTFAKSIDDLQGEMGRLREFDMKLRVMADLDGVATDPKRRPRLGQAKTEIPHGAQPPVVIQLARPGPLHAEGAFPPADGGVAVGPGHLHPHPGAGAVGHRSAPELQRHAGLHRQEVQGDPRRLDVRRLSRHGWLSGTGRRRG